MTDLLVIAFLLQTLRIAAPILLAALGGVMSERSGIVDLSLEGKLLMGALATEIGAHATGSATAGALAGMAGGMATAALYGVVVIRFRADQIVSGIAINMLAIGLGAFAIQLLYGSASNSPKIPGFPGSLLANPLFWIALALVPAVHLLLERTRLGLRVRAAGEHPAAAESLGVRVARIRWEAVLLSGALAGLGGAWLALENHSFVSDMAAGRGYLALAAVIMGNWRPVGAALACLFFGAAQALQIQLKTAGLVAIPDSVASLVPYVLTIVALAGFIGRSRPPASLGRPPD
ncbi:MAG TPA: ABC transporter permease [Kofleriaceae bacterium]|nr:ABC transporter permease [Kofleriaceae bacterium]